MYAAYVNGMPLTPGDARFLFGIYERNRLHARDHAYAQSLVQAIDDYRFAQRHLSRAAAIRRLIELGLQPAKGAGGSAKGRRKAAD
jgi:hypothetical protein